MKAAVYMFAQRDGFIKIGKANNVARRFKQLGGLARFLQEGHYACFVQDEQEAHSLERWIHEFLTPMRVKSANYYGTQPGHTELFREEAGARLLAILGHRDPRALALSVDEWVKDGAVIDSLGHRTGIWLGTRHYGREMMPIDVA